MGTEFSFVNSQDEQWQWQHSNKSVLNALKCILKKGYAGTPVVVQWLSLQAPNAVVPGLIPGQGTRSLMPQLSPSTAK